ncbi:Down syndrome cell adhesion molecule-like protein Dscam2 [Folsomia candida]|uniref:Down syndrome cell adhesion molecule-like protein Dscam2 n=1 Tax=Folsomia candida TaxID=158441 RepID=A0A226DQE1_FOLCA|nr:Down syndrome cell adhesion molecule-like protein Dscam2 [Folsomia candida]
MQILIHVFSNLTIFKVQPGPGGNTKLKDGGNYTCTATNAHGSESVVYAVTVQTPPEAPILHVIEVGYTSLKVVWSTPHSGGSQVKGYLVNYRRDGGDWEEAEVGPRATGHTLQPLLCGSTYQLYITATNKIGSCPASDMLTRSTKGSAPISPKKEEALLSNHSTIVGSAKSYTLTGLHANTRYDIRVTGGNHAGDTLAKYEFLTGSLPPQATTSHGGGKYRGESTGESHDGESAFGENEASTLSTWLLIVFPSILALAMVTAVISFFCYFRRKRHGQGGIMYDAATPHYTLVKGSQGQGYPPDLTAQYATKVRDLAEELESSSSSLDEESSPTRGRTSGRATYCARRAHHHHRHHKSSNKSTSGSSNSGGGGGQIIPRVRSSSGYSSHTEETSFTTREQRPPKFSEENFRKFSKNVEDQLLPGNEEVSEAKAFSMKRNQRKQRQSRSKNKGGFHIDV